MTFLWTTGMKMSDRIPILLFLIFSITSVTGLAVPQPEDLSVNILEGEVIVHWKRPTGSPENSTYNVQMGKYTGDWAKVKKCTETTNLFCDLSSLIHDHDNLYKVRVQLVAGGKTSRWTAKKVRPNESDLQPPSFTLLATSSTLSVYVHHKPILRTLFPYGLTYTIYLEEVEHNKLTTAYLKDDVGEEQRTKTFSSLHFGRKYCVSMMVEGNGALSTSSVSPKQCLLLPEREWFTIGVSSLSILSGLAIIVFTVNIVRCYLRRPSKTPHVLELPKSHWQPLSIEEGVVEVVTDKGWFLSSYRTEGQNCIKYPVTHFTITEDTGEEARRTSMDSGVSMESNSVTSGKSSSLMRQEDSGCGSMGGPGSSTGSQTVYPLQDEQAETDKVRKREDSGVGLGTQLDSSSVNVEGQDTNLHEESVPGGGYRTQGPSVVPIRASDENKALKQILPDTVLAEVITGYRGGPQVCICSGAGQCTWCQTQGGNGSEVVKQYRSICIENVPPSNKRDFYKAAIPFSSYAKRLQMDSVVIDDFKSSFEQLMDNFFPLLSTLPGQEGVGHDFNMNDVSLSLNDVQLKTD